MSIWALFVVLIFSLSAAGQKIQGVWSLTVVTTTGPNGATKQTTQPSMYMFTKNHYSVIYVSSAEARKQIADISKATADELRDVYVNSFVANAGSYVVNIGKLSLRPTVAKNPGFMEPGTFSTLSIKMEGNTMTLVSEGTNTGPAANPTTFKLKRVE
jgi:hypothetical protein